MAESFSCPSCGAPLDYHAGDPAVIHCPFCNTSVVVPADVLAASGGLAGSQPDNPTANTAAAKPAYSTSPQAQQLQAIVALARQGRKIEAIQTLRAISNLDLREANDVVEKMAAGQPFQVRWTQVSTSTQVQAGPQGAQQGSEMQEIIGLIRQGNKIEAITRFHQYFGGSLENAKIAVDRIASALPPATATRIPSPQVQRAKPRLVLLIVFLAFFFILLTGMIAMIVIASTANGFSRAAKSAVSTSETAPLLPAETPTLTPTRGFATPILKFGGEGIGPGLFKDARSIAVDGEGRIYVAEYTGGRVQVFDPQGKFITQWLVDAKSALRALAVSRQGTVYIVQKGQIQRYDGLSGEKLAKVNYVASGSGGDEFDDVVVTPDGGLVAVFMQFDDNIVRMDSKDRPTLQIEKAISSQTDESELDMRVAVDGMGDIYALGTFNEAVFKFSPQGKFINKIGGPGDEPGLFSDVGAIAVDGQGRIYVSDIKGIQVFDPNGRYLDTFEVQEGYPSGLAFNDQNELLVAARTYVLKYSIN